MPCPPCPRECRECIETQPGKIVRREKGATPDGRGGVIYLIQDREYGQCSVKTLESKIVSKEEWIR